MSHLDSRGDRKRMYSLVVLSGFMLGFSFPPFPLGVLAWMGLVPLLVVLNAFPRPRGAFRFIYVAMLVFHLITLNWTGDYVQANDIYMMIAGAVTMTVHPLFYFMPLGVYLLVRRQMGERIALISLPFLWVGYEYLRCFSEWSFPWLTLGNSQTYAIARIQFAEWTGVFGVSFWVITLNIIAYSIVRALIERNALGSKAVVMPVALLIGLAVSPSICGWYLLRSSQDEALGQRDSVTVGIVQSNIDPWDKWNQNGYAMVDMYMRMTRALLESTEVHKPSLVIWPETAVNIDLLNPANQEMLASLRHELDLMNISVLTGMPHLVIYADSSAAPRSARRDNITHRRYDLFNSAALIEPHGAVTAWHGKTKLVPFAERVPYADVLAFLDFLRWGVGIGNWQIGRDTTLFQLTRSGARFNALICYESTYPGFVARFVRRGAEFITVITIDSWWDHMSGAYQHQQIAIFRAIENRRWIARCAVGGISGFIDPYGHVYKATDLLTRRTLSWTIERRRDLTFYTQHGDWLGELSLGVSLMLFFAVTGQAFLRQQRKRLWAHDDGFAE